MLLFLCPHEFKLNLMNNLDCPHFLQRIAFCRKKIPFLKGFAPCFLKNLVLLPYLVFAALIDIVFEKDWA